MISACVCLNHLHGAYSHSVYILQGGTERGETLATLAPTHTHTHIPRIHREKILSDSLTALSMMLVRVCVCPSQGKAQNERLCSGLNMHLCFSPADLVVLMRRRRGWGAVDAHVCLHASQGRPPSLKSCHDNNTNTTATTSQSEAGAVMVTV